MIGGTFCALKTVPGTIEDKLIAAPVALKAWRWAKPKAHAEGPLRHPYGKHRRPSASWSHAPSEKCEAGAAAPVAAAVAQAAP